MISPTAGADGGHQPIGVATTTLAQPDWSGSRPRRLYPARLIPSFITMPDTFGGFGLRQALLKCLISAEVVIPQTAAATLCQ